MKRKIINPFNKPEYKEGHNCFGCSPYNSAGLQLQFVDHDSYIETHWEPQKQFEGFQNILHGGIQSTLMDEVAGWVVFTKCKTSGVTQSIKVEYLSPVYLTDGTLRLEGSLNKIDGKKAIIGVKLYNGNNVLCSEAEVVYYIFPEAVAKRKFYYPGIEAFYD